MSTLGLFTRQDAKTRQSRRTKTTDPVRSAALAGPVAVRRMNPHAVTPEMPPHGGGARVLVLASAPTRQGDEAGEPTAHPHMARIWRAVTRVSDGDCWADHICRTLPPKGRKPTDVEIAAFRKEVCVEIEKRGPHVIVAVGQLVMDWLSPDIGYSIDVHRGRTFPVKIGSYTCSVVPVYDPYTAKKRFSEGSKDGTPEEHEKAFKMDLRRIRDALNVSPKVILGDKKQLLKDCKIFDGPFTESDYVEWSKKFGKSIEFDYEGPGLRPYRKDKPGFYKPHTISVSDGTHTIAVPLFYPDASADIRNSAMESWRNVLRLFKGRNVVAHNLSHDLEWQLVYFPESAQWPRRWHCSEMMAYILNPGSGKSLDYLSRLYLGLPLKALSPGETWKRRHALRELLEYNALDSFVGIKVVRFLQSDLVQAGLIDYYNFRVRQIVTTVQAQIAGVPVSQNVVRRFDGSLTRDIAKTIEALHDDESVIAYESKFKHRFNPASTDHCNRLFRDILKRTEGRKKGGKYSTSEKVLSQLVDVEPVAKKVLDFRGVAKKHSTYVVKFRRGEKDGYVYADDKIHSRISLTRTTTGRSAVEDPNGQNWPKRKGKEVREIVTAPPGHYIVSIDQGQIEARVLAMASKDKVFCKALWDRYDVHMEWTKRILKAYPALMSRRKWKDLKTARSHIKNEFVFPLFYGAGLATVETNSKVPIPVLKPIVRDFWQMFAGIRKWQKRIVEFYEENFYVESLIGFRRYGPLNYNRIINTPIQSAATDINMEGMRKCSNTAIDLDFPWLQSILPIHDDLLFIVPIEKCDRLIETAVPLLLKMPWDFINVPLTVEVERGKNWAAMETVGTFSSDEI